MLFYLFSAEEVGGLFEQLGYPFEYETIPQNIDYCLKRTSHGSTLSRAESRTPMILFRSFASSQKSARARFARSSFQLGRMIDSICSMT